MSTQIERVNVMPAMRDWYERSVVEPRRQESQRKAESRRRGPKLRTPATLRDGSEGVLPEKRKETA